MALGDGEPKWRRRSDERPDEILDAALDEFVERGFDQARVEDVAKRAGLSPAAISRFISGNRGLSRPFAMALEQVTTDAYRLGEVSVAPLRANDLAPLDTAKDDSERTSATG